MKLEQEENVLREAQADAQKRVAEIAQSRDELKSQLSVAQSIQRALGSGFLFAIVGIVFQYRQTRKHDEKHELELRELKSKVTALEENKA